MKNEYDWTLEYMLKYAVTNNDIGEVEVFLKKGVNVNYKFIEPILSTSIRNYNYELTKLLIDNGADVNFSGIRSPLCRTIFSIDLYDENKSNSSANILKLLIENGVEVTAYHVNYVKNLVGHDIFYNILVVASEADKAFNTEKLSAIPINPELHELFITRLKHNFMKFGLPIDKDYNIYKNYFSELNGILPNELIVKINVLAGNFEQDILIYESELISLIEEISPVNYLLLEKNANKFQGSSDEMKKALKFYDNNPSYRNTFKYLENLLEDPLECSNAVFTREDIINQLQLINKCIIPAVIKTKLTKVINELCQLYTQQVAEDKLAGLGNIEIKSLNDDDNNPFNWENSTSLEIPSDFADLAGQETTINGSGTINYDLL